MSFTDVLAFLTANSLELIGGASAVAALLRNILPYLEAYADRTITDADNRAVETLGVGLALFTALLDTLHKLADTMGLNPKVARQTDEPEVSIEESDSPSDESSDGSI